MTARTVRPGNFCKSLSDTWIAWPFANQNDEWLGKFVSLLRQLYWWSVVVHLSTDFEPDRVFAWQPTEAAMAGLYAEPPQPVGEWVRSVRTSE